MQPEKMHHPISQENIVNEVEEESVSSCIPMFERHKKMAAHSDKCCSRETTGSSNIKCLKDILTESEPDTPVSLHSCNSSSVEEIFLQVFHYRYDRSFKKNRNISKDNTI